MKKESVRKPSFLYYWLAGVVTRPVFKALWNHKIIRDKKINKLEGPIIAVGNHCSTIDVVMSIHALLPKRYNVITGKDLFTWKPLKPFIEAFGCIPKSQCSLDLNSMRTMKNAVEQGRNLLLYPEGKTSLDGTELKYLPATIGKFLKFLDGNVVSVHTNGAFLTRPRYCKGFKRGLCVTETKVLITREELRTLKNNEVYERVRDALRFNDNLWQREKGIRFVSDAPAQNLNYVLYKCPACGAEYEMTSDGRNLICGNCGNTVEYTEYGELIPKNGGKAFDRIDLWYDFERESATEELKKENFRIEKEVTLFVENHSKAEFEERGEGRLFLTRDEIGFIGTVDGKETELIQSLNGMNSIVTKNSEGVDLTFDDTIYRFMFKEGKWSAKYGLLVEQNFALKNGFIK
ncbi:MAG: 1-acyl-sn-glycerol-3-phosphate acyltransferase [Christensenellales bacterium]